MNAKDLMKKRFIAVDKNDTIAHFLGQVYNNYIDTARDAIVLDRGKYYGMTSKRFLTRSKMDPQTMKVEKITENVPKLTGNEDIIEIARLMFTSDRQILPVIEKGKVIGIVKAIDVVEQIKNIPDLKNLEIGEIATTHPITIGEDEKIGQAIAVMKDHGISRIPVVDKNGKAVNIVSLRDVIHHFLFFNQSKSERRGAPENMKTRGFNAQTFPARALPVKDIATPVLVSASEEKKVKSIIDDLKKFNISSMIVVRFGEPIGIITVRDLLRLLLREQLTY